MYGFFEKVTSGNIILSNVIPTLSAAKTEGPYVGEGCVLLKGMVFPPAVVNIVDFRKIPLS